MTPSPFEVSQAFANNVAGARQNIKDRSAIDEILMQANQSGKPEDIHNAMSQILQRVSPERQEGALAILQNKQKMIQEDQQRQRINAAYKKNNLDESLQYLPNKIQENIASGQGDQTETTIADRFGPEAEALWKNSTEGGRTHLLKYLLDNEERTGGLNQKLNDNPSPQPKTQSAQSPQQNPAIPQQNAPNGIPDAASQLSPLKNAQQPQTSA